ILHLFWCFVVHAVVNIIFVRFVFYNTYSKNRRIIRKEIINGQLTGSSTHKTGHFRWPNLTGGRPTH
ncbi:hypothetical protein ACJX0J_038861, partial [Zea mays]